MFLIVIIRSIIEVDTFDFSSLNKVRQPTVPAFSWDSTTQTWSYSDIGDLSDDLDAFFEYS